MRNYDSYNAAYPLAYYELGTIYSFYGKTTSSSTSATADQIRKYSAVLQELEADTSSAVISSGSKASKEQTQGVLQRYYAVVVDKVDLGGNSYIVAMLCCKSDGRTQYITRNYAVNTTCFTDSKNLMPPVAHLNSSPETNKPAEAPAGAKVGGITRAELGKKVGGITRADNTAAETSSGIGGITRVEKKKVGGITRA